MRNGTLHRFAAGAMVVSIMSACATPSLRRSNASEPVTVAAASATAWATTLLDAQREVERGRHADADRLLREFAERTSPAPEAMEAMYWRAVFMLDPSSSAGSTREAVSLLGRYLNADVSISHRTEAGVLQRIATTLATAREAAAGRSAATDVEVKALKEELEQTKAELERIRKRLAPPPAPPTTPPPSADSE